MKKALVKVNNIPAGILKEIEKNKQYVFSYFDHYNGAAVSLTMPLDRKKYIYNEFPPFFDGLLPEGVQLEALLKQKKIDKNDLFTQLITVGADLVGAINVEPYNE